MDHACLCNVYFKRYEFFMDMGSNMATMESRWDRFSWCEHLQYCWQPHEFKNLVAVKYSSQFTGALYSWLSINVCCGAKTFLRLHVTAVLLCDTSEDYWITNINKMDISQNPLRCNKSLCWVLNRFHRLELTTSKYPCAGPARLREVPLDLLQPDMLGCGKSIWTLQSLQIKFMKTSL